MPKPLLILLALATLPVARAQDAAPEAQMTAGKTAYTLACSACHQPNGLGLPSIFPPVAKSPYTTGNAERYAAMILKGNTGPMTVDGKTYNNVMPPQEATLTDEKIAAIMTYTRGSFGNSASAVSPELVKATRGKFRERTTAWTQPELDAWKD